MAELKTAILDTGSRVSGWGRSVRRGSTVSTASTDLSGFASGLRHLPNAAKTCFRDRGGHGDPPLQGNLPSKTKRMTVRDDRRRQSEAKRESRRLRCSTNRSERSLLTSDICRYIFLLNFYRRCITGQKEDVLRGTLDLLVQKTLETLGPLHGYGIARRIEQVSEDILQLALTFRSSRPGPRHSSYIFRARGVGKRCVVAAVDKTSSPALDAAGSRRVPDAMALAIKAASADTLLQSRGAHAGCDACGRGATSAWRRKSASSIRNHSDRSSEKRSHHNQ
jgi:hypothetical protein